MKPLAIALIVGAFAASPAPAATGVQLTIRDGLVWLTAERATVGQVLAEWTRVGGTEIVNGDRVPGGPLTIALNGVPELEALDVVLRAAGGYVALGRTTAPDAGGRTSASQFTRIVIAGGARSATVTPRPTPAATRTPAVAPQVPVTDPVSAPEPEMGARIIGPDGQPVPDDQEDAPPPTNGSIPPGFSPPPEDPAPPVPQLTPTPRPTIPPGVSTPGMMPPAPPGAPVRPPRRPGGVER